MLITMLEKVKGAIVGYKKREQEVGDKAYVVADSDSKEEKRALNSVNVKYLAQKEKLLAKKEKMLAEREAKLREMYERKRAVSKLEYFDEYDIDEIDESKIDVFAARGFMYDPFMGLIDDPFMPENNRSRDRSKRWFDPFGF